MTLELIKKTFLKNGERIAGACEGVSQEEATFRPYDKMNSLIWELGHVNVCRNTIIKILNPNEELDKLPDENATFGNGSKLMDEYPTVAEILAHIDRRGKRIVELLSTATEEQLTAESHIKIPQMGITVGQQTYSFLIHEANHFGEIHYIKTLIHRLRA